MANPIFHLYQLQKLDSRLDFIHDRIFRINSILGSDARIRQAEEILAEKKKIHHELQIKLREIEEIIKEKRVKIEQSEASLYGGGIKNPKELQDVQKEIESIKSNILRIEDSQLEIMLDLEIAEKNVFSAEEELKSVTSCVFQEHSQLLAEKDALEKDMHKLTQEKNATAGQIKPEDLQLYENLRKKNKGIAVSIIDDNCCSACGVSLTPAECQAAKSPASLKFCSSCGRLLYAG